MSISRLPRDEGEKHRGGPFGAGFSPPVALKESRLLISCLLRGACCLTLMIAATTPRVAQDGNERIVERLEQLEQALELSPASQPPLLSLTEGPRDLPSPFTFGGYGEVHGNFTEGPGNDEIDIHRFVLYMGYQFEDWIQLHSETEIEHAFVSEGDGELSIEQLHFDFLTGNSLNIRAGRVLTPVGITNLKHEPPSFNGVERPSFDKYILPTTWSSDGIGLFGKMMSDLKYQIYLVGGLDGEGFSSENGIRGGRIKERPSLNEPAITGRIDFYPFVRLGNPAAQTLRLGLSGYGGGLDNGNHGVDPGVESSIWLASADFEYSVHSVDLRGAVAHEQISGAREIAEGIASDIFGFYLEVALHILPDRMKIGRFSESDLVLFARYDDVDTQFEVPSGVVKNDAGTRDEVTLGFTWSLTRQVVVKGDIQLRDDANPGDLPTLFNFGLGWEF